MRIEKMTVIDDDEVLHTYYDDRETFVVDFDENLVWVDMRDISKGTVIFHLKTVTRLLKELQEEAHR
jgi:hypothetical protein